MSEQAGGTPQQGRGHQSRRPPSRGRGRGSPGHHGHFGAAPGAHASSMDRWLSAGGDSLPLSLAPLRTFRLDSGSSTDGLIAVAGPHGPGASARRWGPPPQPAAAPDADLAPPNAATAPTAEAAIRETGTIASLKPHYGFIR